MGRNHITHGIYVGDSQIDCDAAKQANVAFVYASYGFGKVNHYQYSISSLKELLSFVEQNELKF